MRFTHSEREEVKRLMVGKALTCLSGASSKEITLSMEKSFRHQPCLFEELKIIFQSLRTLRESALLENDVVTGNPKEPIAVICLQGNWED